MRRVPNIKSTKMWRENGFEEKTWINLILAENSEKKRKNTFFHSFSLSLTHTSTFKRECTIPLSLSLAHTCARTHTRSLTHTHTNTCSHVHTHSLTHAHYWTHNSYLLPLFLSTRTSHFNSCTHFIIPAHSFILDHLNRHIVIILFPLFVCEAKSFSMLLFYSPSSYVLTVHLSHSLPLSFLHPRILSHTRTHFDGQKRRKKSDHYMVGQFHLFFTTHFLQLNWFIVSFVIGSFPVWKK